MAYRFKIAETPERALRRIGLEQLERALRALSAADTAGSVIHETRKCLKRLRALLRLVRPGLDEGVFHNENARYREIAALLSPARDAQILVETLIKLEPFAAAADAAELAAFTAHIDQMQVPDAVSERADMIAAARSKLNAAKSAMSKLDIAGSDFGCVEQGLRASYRKGLERFRCAYCEGTDEAFHDWRKSVQLHWRHMALLSRAWPDMFSARVEAARQLSHSLGDSQDLSVLVVQVETLPAGVLPKSGAGRLVRLARKRQQHLRASAEPRGAQIFSLPPKALAHSVMTAWHAARVLDQLADKTLQSAPAKISPAEPHTSDAIPVQAAPLEKSAIAAPPQTKPATRRPRSRAPA